LATQFAERLNSFADALKAAGPWSIRDPFPDPRTIPDDPVWGKGREELVGAINWLAEETRQHNLSVDAFARKLFLDNDKDNLNKLKAALSAYLVGEQARKDVDPRYNEFFSHVLEHDKGEGLRLPQKLRILTWNYDTQLEKAFYGFSKDEKLVLEKITTNRRQIRRPNGCCGQESPGNIDGWFRAVWDETADAGWKAAIDLYKKYTSKPPTGLGPEAVALGLIDSPALVGPSPNICFAWENETLRLAHLTNSPLHFSYIEGLEEVSVIVAIGYSFPPFNREVDEEIFGRMAKLRHVYLQYPEGSHAEVTARVERLLVTDVKPVERANVDSFYIPDDFYDF